MPTRKRRHNGANADPTRGVVASQQVADSSYTIAEKALRREADPTAMVNEQSQHAVVSRPGPAGRDTPSLAGVDAQPGGTMSIVSRARWADALDAFSRRHVNYPVRLEIDAANMGAQIGADRTTLRGVSFDPKSHEVEVMLEADGGSHLTHAIQAPEAIDVLPRSAKRREVLRIAHPGGQTLLHVLDPARPA